MYGGVFIISNSEGDTTRFFFVSSDRISMAIERIYGPIEGFAGPSVDTHYYFDMIPNEKEMGFDQARPVRVETLKAVKALAIVNETEWSGYQTMCDKVIRNWNVVTIDLNEEKETYQFTGGSRTSQYSSSYTLSRYTTPKFGRGGEKYTSEIIFRKHDQDPDLHSVRSF